MRDYRTRIDTQPMTISCYDYVDTKLIINVYRFIIIDISCQIVTNFSNHIELINRLSTVGRRQHTSIQNLYSVFAGEIVTIYRTRQCHNSPTQISVRDYRTKIDTQSMTNICYEYVDAKLIINVYRFIFIDLSCQIINQFSNRIELINRLSEQSAEDGTHLYIIGTLLFVG